MVTNIEYRPVGTLQEWASYFAIEEAVAQERKQFTPNHTTRTGSGPFAYLIWSLTALGNKRLVAG